MSIKGIELRHLRYFAAVAELRNFRKAADHLNMAQPPLSRAIQQLEAAVGHPLLDRSSRRVALTAAGQRFLEGCHATLRGMEVTVEETRLLAAGFTGSIRIGYTDLAISGRLPSILTAFHKAYPNIIQKPYHGVTNDQLKRLTSGELDVGFLTGPLHFQGLETYLVQEEQYVCVVYEDHPLAQRDSVLLKDLAKEKFVHGSSRDWEQFQAQLFPLCSRAGFLPDVVQEAFNSAAILSLVAGRMGITILTEGTAKSAISGLVVLPISDIDAKIQTYFVWRAEDDTAATAAFKQLLQNSALLK